MTLLNLVLSLSVVEESVLGLVEVGVCVCMWRLQFKKIPNFGDLKDAPCMFEN